MQIDLFGEGRGAKLIYKSNLVRLTVFDAAITPSPPQRKRMVLPPPSSLVCTHLHTTSVKLLNKLLHIRTKYPLALYDTAVGSSTVNDCCLVYS